MSKKKLFKVCHNDVGEKMAEAYSPKQAKLIVFLKYVVKGKGFTPSESARSFKTFNLNAKAFKL